MIGLAGQYIFFGGKIRVEFVLNCVFGALAAITGKESSTGCLIVICFFFKHEKASARASSDNFFLLLIKSLISSLL